MIELTEQQQHILDSQPQPVVIDPRTQQTYILVQAEMFKRLKNLLTLEEDQNWSEDAYRLSMEVFGREGWNDPAMGIYDALDSRRQRATSTNLPRSALESP